MSSRSELLTHLWSEVINVAMKESNLQNEIANSKRRPNDPFADAGAALERLLALGPSAKDICLIRRSTAYEAAFGTLYALEDPGAGDDDLGGLYEELLTADPSGLEGRPGSARSA